MKQHVFCIAIFLCIAVRTQCFITYTCEGSQLSINCALTSQFIVVNEAFYGRKDIFFCPCLTNCNNTNCASSSNATSILVSKCEGKQSCIVDSSNAIFGEPCYGTSKYLYVNYECVQISRKRPPIITKTACENKQMAINCPENHKILVIEALYGRKQILTCPCSDTCGNIYCASSNSTSILISKCQDKQSCIVESSNSIFGEPCLGTSKYLQATYQCVLNCPYGTYTSDYSCKDCGLTTSTTTSSFRILNGKNATYGAFPSVVRILYLNQFICTGTLISERTVLTSPFCLEYDNNPNSYTVDYGVNNLNTDVSNYVSVDKLIVHELYDSSSARNVISLLILKDKVTLGPNADVACLPNFDSSFPIEFDVSATVVGWGYINQAPITSASILQFAPQLISDPSSNYCLRCIRNHTTQLCTAYTNSQSACTGDGGGPLFINETINGQVRQVVVGIFAYRCQVDCDKSPSIFTNVKPYYDWIRINMK